MIAVASKTSGDSGGSATSSATAAITTTAGKLYAIWVSAYVSSGSVQPPQPTVTFNGSGLAFDVVASVDIDTSGADRQTMWLFRGVASAGSSGTTTIDFGAVAAKHDWAIDEIDGVDTSGINGSAAIVQSATAQFASGATSGTVSLAAFADATNNAAYGVFDVQSSSSGVVSYTAGTGFTKLGEDTGNVATLASEYRVGQDTTVDMTWSGASVFRSAGIAVELKAASSGSVIDAAAQALTSESSVSGVGSAILRGLASTSAQSNAQGSGRMILVGVGALQGTGSLTGIGDVLLPGVTIIDAAAVALVAGSSLTNGSPIVLVGASPVELAALSALSGSGVLRLSGSGALVGSSDLTGSGLRVLYGQAAFSALATMIGSGGIAPKFGAPTVLVLEAHILNALALDLSALNTLALDLGALNTLDLEVTSS